VNEGSFWLDPIVAEAVIKVNPNFVPAEGSKTKLKSNQKTKFANLTKREYEILRLIVEGKSNNDIAQELNISFHTARTHVSNIMQKLVVDDRTQAAVKAIKENLV